MQFNTALENVNGLEIENSSNHISYPQLSFNNRVWVLIRSVARERREGHPQTSWSGITMCLIIITSHFGEARFLESVVPKGLGILVLGADNVTIEIYRYGQRICRHPQFSATIVLGSLAVFLQKHLLILILIPDNARIIRNLVKKNGSQFRHRFRSLYQALISYGMGQA
jgi:hypothetical protein